MLDFFFSWSHQVLQVHMLVDPREMPEGRCRFAGGWGNASPDNLCVAQILQRRLHLKGLTSAGAFCSGERLKLTSLKWETVWGADASVSFCGDLKIVQRCFTCPFELRSHTVLVLLKLKEVPLAHHGKQLSLIPLANKIPSEKNKTLSLCSDAAFRKGQNFSP